MLNHWANILRYWPSGLAYSSKELQTLRYCWDVPKTDEVLFEIDMWELALNKLDKIPISSNLPDDSKNNMGNINIGKTKEDGLDGEKGSSGTKCCLSKIEKLAVPARVALLQGTNIWVGDSGVSVHHTNNR